MFNRAIWDMLDTIGRDLQTAQNDRESIRKEQDDRFNHLNDARCLRMDNAEKAIQKQHDDLEKRIDARIEEVEDAANRQRDDINQICVIADDNAAAIKTLNQLMEKAVTIYEALTEDAEEFREAGQTRDRKLSALRSEAEQYGKRVYEVEQEVHRATENTENALAIAERMEAPKNAEELDTIHRKLSSLYDRMEDVRNAVTAMLDSYKEDIESKQTPSYLAKRIEALEVFLAHNPDIADMFKGIGKPRRPIEPADCNTVSTEELPHISKTPVPYNCVQHGGAYRHESYNELHGLTCPRCSEWAKWWEEWTKTNPAMTLSDLNKAVDEFNKENAPEPMEPDTTSVEIPWDGPLERRKELWCESWHKAISGGKTPKQSTDAADKCLAAFDAKFGEEAIDG